MKYRQVGNLDVSEVALDCSVAKDLTTAQMSTLVEKAFDLGIDFFHALQPAEATALGDCLGRLDARRRAIVAAGVPRLFAAYASHHMPTEEFLEHELSDRIERLGGGYIDCFVLDLGRGKAVDFDAVLKEDLSPGGDDRAVATSSYEGGIFLHETLAECLEVLGRFKQEGRIRVSAVSGENITAVRRVLVKHPSIDAALVPYNYGFRAAEEELIPVAAETKTSVVATRPLWWGIREIPVTVLAESPYPKDAARIGLKAAGVVRTACKWPLGTGAVAGILGEARTSEELADLAAASSDSHWTRDDEETLRAVASVAAAQRGIFLILSAMNSKDPALRAHGWAACLRRELPDFGYDPSGDEESRAASLKRVAEAVIQQAPAIPEEGLDELL